MADRSMVSRCESKNYLFVSSYCRRSVSVDGVGCHAFDCFYRGKNDLVIIFLLYTSKCLYISIAYPRFLRYSRVGRFNIFRLSGYSRLPKPSTSLVARICTFSRASIYLVRYGDHTLWAYSKWGRTNAVYIFLKELQFKKVKLLRIKPAMLFAFLIFAGMCSSKDIRIKYHTEVFLVIHMLDFVICHFVTMWVGNIYKFPKH